MAETLNFPNIELQPKSNVGKSDSLIMQWMMLAAAQQQVINLLCLKLPEAASMVEDSTTELSSKFRELASGAEEQGEQVQKIVDSANSIQLDGESISLEDFTNLFKETIDDSIQKILFISKMAMSMVYSMDDAIESLADVEAFVEEIQNINKKANLLALNATIEAVRAGDVGKGFNVVAGEVKGISKNIAVLSTKMQEKIGLVSERVRKGYGVLQEVATTDMSDHIMAKDKLDNLMTSFMDQNSEFSETLQNAADTSHKISGNISKMIMGIQFQDRTSQYIENSVNILRSLQQKLEELSEASQKQKSNQLQKEQVNLLIRELSEHFTLSDFKQALLQASGQKEETSEEDLEDIELF